MLSQCLARYRAIDVCLLVCLLLFVKHRCDLFDRKERRVLFGNAYFVLRVLLRSILWWGIPTSRVHPTTDLSTWIERMLTLIVIINLKRHQSLQIQKLKISNYR